MKKGSKKLKGKVEFIAVRMTAAERQKIVLIAKRNQSTLSDVMRGFLRQQAAG
jgi:hypothetical protein